MSFSFLGRWGSGRRVPVRRDNRSRMHLLNLEERAVPAQIAYAAASGAGTPAGSQVAVFDQTGALITSFDAFPGFTGGVTVDVGDVNNDGVNDVVVGAGAGGAPIVRVFDGAGLQGGIERSLADFYGQDPAFTGGIYVAAGDLNGDNFKDIVVGPGVGGAPLVLGFNGQTFDKMVAFIAFPPQIGENGQQQFFYGGVRVACGDVGGDNGGVAGGTQNAIEEIVCGAGPGGGSHVTVWQYDNQFYEPDRFISFFAYETGFTGGVYVGAGRFTNNTDVDGFIYSDIITGAGEGGGPLMRIWSTDDASDRDNYVLVLAREQIVNDPNARNGLRVAGVRTFTTSGLSTGSNGLNPFITSQGVGSTDPTGLALFTTDTPEPPPVSEYTKVGILNTFDPGFGSAFTGGVFVGG